MKILQNIIDETGFERMISRLAHEILERNFGASNLVIIGLRSRGEFAAKRIRDKIVQLEAISLPLGILDVTLYRDDIRQHLRQPEVRATSIEFDVTDKHVILVDDVLFTGRTVRSALDALMDLGRAKTVQLVVLVDRGHRELPIQADFTGKTIKTSRGEEVRVKLREVDGEDGIDLISVE
jgi:pyrimidine operon attenuation protein / uracil phosphoribosyltransferase